MRVASFLRTAAFAMAGMLIAIASAEEAANEEHVVVLTKENFDQHLEAHPLTLIEFYAPWCGHCKRLAPEYAKAAEELIADNIPLAKVDATEENALATKYNIKGFPTLFLFRNGEPEEYTGGRTQDSIVAWVRRMSRPAVANASGMDEAKKMTEGEEFSVVAVVKSEDSDGASVFKLVAEGNRVAGTFIQVVDSSVESETARIYRSSDDFVSDPIEITTAEEMGEKMKGERLPYFGAVSGDNFRDYVSSGMDLAWFAGTEKNYEDAKDEIRQAAKEVRGKVLFLWLDTDKFGDHAVRALAVKDYPALVYQKAEDSSRYIFIESDENKFPSKDVVQFVVDVQAGKIEKSLMSEPIPETNDEPVKIVVGKNFEEIVMDPTKEILLEVYAPWCGHCKKFEPEYAEFATRAAKNKNLVIAKMDGTANESPVADFEWRGFPTVFWVPAGDEKKPVQYDGPRTVQGLADWVTSHSAHNFVLEDEEEGSEELAVKDEL